jgi:hypothetical protein
MAIADYPGIGDLLGVYTCCGIANRRLAGMDVTISGTIASHKYIQSVRMNGI